VARLDPGVVDRTGCGRSDMRAHGVRFAGCVGEIDIDRRVSGFRATADGVAGGAPPAIPLPRRHRLWHTSRRDDP